jgi:hypothetical protein
MALPESELRAVLKAVGAFVEKRRPRPEIRDKLDIRVHINGSEVLITEVRPAFHDKRKKQDTPVARIRWFNSRKIWRLFWMRSDLKWHAYEPYPEASRIATHLRTVDEDYHCCFFG